MTSSLPANLEDAHREIERLRQQVALLQKYLFGRRSEQRPAEDNPEQMNLFEAPPEATPEEAEEEISVPPSKPRKKGGRRPLPADLPRVEEVVDVPAEQRKCSCGSEKHCMGEDVTEELEIVPARVFVRRIVRPKYVCKHCSRSVEQAPLPPRAVPRCMAGPGFLSYMIVSKYADHIPLCRIERILGRENISISRSNMCEWVMRLHLLMLPLIALMKVRLLESDVIQSDDTPIRVQQMPGPGTSRCYLWLYRGDHKAPYTIYDFRRNRSKEGPSDILDGYSGFLQADAYCGYHDVYKLVDKEGQPRIREAGCWAHARRRFIEAMEAGDERAQVALDFIGQLYGIEKQAREGAKGKSDSDLHALRGAMREERSRTLLNQLFTWMEDRYDVLPQSPLGKALTYAQNNREALSRFAFDGRLDIDNNAAERALRPVAVGRKNWLFAGSPRGGEAAATFFTLIESAARAGANPLEYLQALFTELPDSPQSQLAQWLPDRWAAARAATEGGAEIG